MIQDCFLQGILFDVLKCLGDKNKNTREHTIATLDSWVAAVHIDKMVASCFVIFYLFMYDGFSR